MFITIIIINSLALITPVLPGKGQFLDQLAADVSAVQEQCPEWDISWKIVFDGRPRAEELATVGSFSPAALPRQSGASAARNEGLSLSADYQWIYPIDADDRLDLHGMSEILAALQASNDPWLATSRKFIDGQQYQAFSTDQDLSLAAGDFISRHQRDLPIPHPNSIFFRRQYLQQLGGWNPRFRYYQDLALALLATDRDPGLWSRQTATIFRPWGGNISSSPRYQQQRDQQFSACYQLVNDHRQQRQQEPARPPAVFGAAFERELNAWLDNERITDHPRTTTSDK